MAKMTDAEFDNILSGALQTAAKLDYMDFPPDDEIEKAIQPSAKFEKRMQALLGNPDKYIMNRRKPVYMEVLKNIAAVFAAVVLLFGIVMAVSPTARATVIGFVRSIWHSDHTVYETTSGLINRKLTVGHIPDGFELIEYMNTEQVMFFVYSDNNSHFITIHIGNGKSYVNNERTMFYKTIINEKTAEVYERLTQEDGNIIVMYDDIANTVVTLTASIEIDELIKIAENIVLTD